MQTEEYSLREKRTARLKVALMQTFIEKLKSSRFDDVSIREVCRAAEVGETTFYNHFPDKIDVIGYYLQIATRNVIARAVRKTPKGKMIPLINGVFSLIAAEFGNANMLYQIISVFLMHKEMPRKVEISSFEVKLAFPDYVDIDSDEMRSAYIDEFFAKAAACAIKNGELLPKTKVEDVVVTLMTILSGTPIAVKFGDEGSRGYHYKRQLRAFWADITGKENGDAL